MRYRRLDDWLSWQESLHPTGMKLGLDRCIRLRERFRWRELPFSIVTVGGTNGKGSTVALLEAVFRAHGLRTGTYTSPHLQRYNERIRIDGEEATDLEIVSAFDEIDRTRGEDLVTYFEFGTFAAVHCFVKRSIDVAILEVGIGGRLDAVNVFDPDVAIVTPIALDHANWLGPTRESAGFEKAGILRSGRPAVLTDPDPPRSLLGAAKRLVAPIWRLGTDFGVEMDTGSLVRWTWRGPEGRIGPLPLPALFGRFQLDNAAGAIMGASRLLGTGVLSEARVAHAMRSVRLRGRFEELGTCPYCVLDIAHNPHAAESLARSLARRPCEGRSRAVFAMLSDKDRAGVVQRLRGAFEAWYVAGLDGERGSGAEPTAAAVRSEDPGAVVASFPSVRHALSAALGASAPADRIVVFGSCHTVGEALDSGLLPPAEDVRPGAGTAAWTNG